MVVEVVVVAMFAVVAEVVVVREDFVLLFDKITIEIRAVSLGMGVAGFKREKNTSDKCLCKECQLS